MLRQITLRKSSAGARDLVGGAERDASVIILAGHLLVISGSIAYGLSIAASRNNEDDLDSAYRPAY